MLAINQIEREREIDHKPTERRVYVITLFQYKGLSEIQKEIFFLQISKGKFVGSRSNDY